MPPAGLGGDSAVLLVCAADNADSVQPSADPDLFHSVSELRKVDVQISERNEGKHQHEADKGLPGPRESEILFFEAASIPTLLKLAMYQDPKLAILAVTY